MDHYQPRTGPRRILIVDDLEENRELMRRMLRHDGYAFVEAASAQEATQAFDPQSIDLVVLDLRLPDGSGIDVCRDIKEEQADSFVPVIMVTASGDTEDKVMGFNAGADDFVSRPIPVVELRARVRAMLRLKSAQDQLRWAAVTDGLTGLFNHKHTLDRLAAEMDRARRYNRPLSVIMGDLDHFKQVNDKHGHRFGDFVLEGTAERLRHTLRTVDIIGRYGGEEFFAILPETTLFNAALTAERVRRSLAESPFTNEEREITVTISVGVTDWNRQQDESLDSLVARVDAALYSAKEGGRDRVIVGKEQAPSS